MIRASSLSRTVVFAVLLAASGCGSGASGAAPTVVTAEPTRATAAAQNAQPPPAGDGALPTPAPGTYEVHEWGLMRQRAGDVLDVGAAPPVVRAEPMVVDKPILYFHAGGQVRIERIDVVASGDILEHWPLVAAGRPHEISWRGLALDAGRRVGMSSCVLGAYPTASEPPCAGLGGDACESSRLGPLLARGAACLDSSHGQHAFLFYRSRTNAFTPPLRLERLDSGDVRATNTGDVAIPGSLVVIRRRNGGTTARAIAAPPAHQSVSLTQASPSDSTTADMPVMPSDTGSGRRAIVDTMRALGLADGEIEAFLVAWEPALFGQGAAANDDRVTVDELSTDRRGTVDLPPADSVLYFLPTSTCDRVSRLSFAPAPRAVRRALAVWGALP